MPGTHDSSFMISLSHARNDEIHDTGFCYRAQLSMCSSALIPSKLQNHHSVQVQRAITSLNKISSLSINNLVTFSKISTSSKQQFLGL